jgi:hypothetical protein
MRDISVYVKSARNQPRHLNPLFPNMNIGFPPFVRSARIISALSLIVLNDCNYDQMDVLVPDDAFKSFQSPAKMVPIS